GTRPCALRLRVARLQHAPDRTPIGVMGLSKDRSEDGLLYSVTVAPAGPWCSGPTCQPVTLEIAGSNPVGPAIHALSGVPRMTSTEHRACIRTLRAVLP